MLLRVVVFIDVIKRIIAELISQVRREQLGFGREMEFSKQLFDLERHG